MENQNETVEENAAGWEAPPPPANPPVQEEEPAQMSEVATLGNIFFEPGRTFEDLRRKPRFLMALVLLIIAITTYTFLFFSKMGDERMRRSMVEQMEKNPRMDSLSAEQKQQQIDIGMTITKYVRFAIPIFIVIGFAIGGLLYWLGGRIMGGSGNFLHGMSAWVYSSFPPTMIAMLANIVVLFLKSADDIDIASSQRGVLQANPSFLIDGKSMPVLATILSTFDFFQIWGWILAAIGIHKLSKISKGAAWGVVMIIALIGVAYRVLSALMSGNPM
jgi:hypothetical protein